MRYLWKGLMGLMLSAGWLTSCVMEEDMLAKAGKASVTIDLNADAAFTTETKAVDEHAYTNISNYTVEIWQNETIKKSFAYSDRPSSIELPNGTYTLKAFYGTDMTYSRTGFRVEGGTIFNLEGQDMTVPCNCYPTAGKLKVQFDASMTNYFTDYYVVFTTPSIPDNTVIWTKSDTDPWYIRLAKGGETVTAAITLTPKSDYVVSSTTVPITRTHLLKPNEAWALQIAPAYTSNNGQLGISIKVDTGTNDKPIDIIVPTEWTQTTQN
ncbi:MAG: DUF4493 domain-containing protein [Parabacteroides sp.]